MNDAVKRVLEIAAKEVGVREVGNNSGKRVKQYQAATTLGGTNWPWCAAFIAWDIHEGLGEDVARDVWMPSASCDNILDWARRKEIVSTQPSLGCAGLVMASKNDATHIFLVSGVEKTGVRTIEGNTNDGGSRNGNGVYERFRPYSKRYLFVHWPKLLPSADGAETFEAYGLYFGDRKVIDLPVVDGRAMVPAYKWAAWMRAQIGWDMEAQTVTINGREVLAQPMLIENRAWLPIRALVEFSGLNLEVDNAKRKITVTR